MTRIYPGYSFIRYSHIKDSLYSYFTISSTARSIFRGQTLNSELDYTGFDRSQGRRFTAADSISVPCFDYLVLKLRSGIDLGPSPAWVYPAPLIRP
jgi:hypothetical protein